MENRLRYSLIITISLFLLFSSMHAPANNLGIDSWGYQLQDYDIATLKDAQYDLLVLDYSKDGSDQGRFSPAEIASIENQDKTLLSYISIGEAEDYRYYFDSSWKSNPPSWMDGENPDWKGNYKVKYWDQAWQQIIYGYLDKIMAQGFNGVYLDIIDAYEFYQDSYPNARQGMINFVLAIANYTRTSDSNFLIFPQNGEELLENQTYAATVSGIGKEDLFVLPDEQQIRPAAELSELYSYLDILINLDKPVLTVDYTSDPDLISQTREMAMTKGYIEYIGTLDLDTLLAPDYNGVFWKNNLFLIFGGGGLLVLVVGILVIYKRRS